VYVDGVAPAGNLGDEAAVVLLEHRHDALLNRVPDVGRFDDRIRFGIEDPLKIE
jgi:hypothetical protein